MGLASAGTGLMEICLAGEIDEPFVFEARCR